MTKAAWSFKKLLDDCLISMGDPSGTTWDRTTVIWPWAVQAILEFPTGRPMTTDLTVPPPSRLYIALPSIYRDMISVEYPIAQTPPSYLVRKNHLSPNFYDLGNGYDIDRDYFSEEGWMLWLPALLAAGAQVRVNLLAEHETDQTDEVSSLMTIPEQYEDILVANVMAKGYRERLGVFMQDPTAHQEVIGQMVKTVEFAEAKYLDLIDRMLGKFVDSRVSPRMPADKYDRVY